MSPVVRLFCFFHQQSDDLHDVARHLVPVGQRFPRGGSLFQPLCAFLVQAASHSRLRPRTTASQAVSLPFERLSPFSKMTTRSSVLRQPHRNRQRTAAEFGGHPRVTFRGIQLACHESIGKGVHRVYHQLRHILRQLFA